MPPCTSPRGIASGSSALPVPLPSAARAGRPAPAARRADRRRAAAPMGGRHDPCRLHPDGAPRAARAARAAAADQLGALSLRPGAERAMAPGGGGTRRARGEHGRTVSSLDACSANNARTRSLAARARSIAPGPTSCAGRSLMSALWGAHGRAGDDRGPGGDPADPDAPRALHGGRGSVAGRAGVAGGGEPLGVGARFAPAAHSLARRALAPPGLSWPAPPRRPAPRSDAPPRLGHYTPRAARGGRGNVRLRTLRQLAPVVVPTACIVAVSVEVQEK